MADRKRRRSAIRASNKENLVEVFSSELPSRNKDQLEMQAQQQLNELSDVDFKRADIFRDNLEEISGWNQVPNLKNKILGLRSTSQLKPSSASRSRIPLHKQIVQPRMTPLVNQPSFHNKTAAIETLTDEVLVCKPIATEPTDNENIIFEHKLVEPAPKQPKNKEQPSKLYDIIKSIELENSKLIRKLFREKSLFRQWKDPRNPQYRKSSLKSRPTSNSKRQVSKEHLREEPRSNTQSIFNFILCSQKGMMPTPIKHSRTDVRVIDDGYGIFCPSSKNMPNRYVFRNRVTSGSACRNH